MRKDLKNLKFFFEPGSVAVIGASRTRGRVGNVILRNFAEGGFKGKVFPVNPGADEIIGLKSYKSILDISVSVDLAVICTAAKFVPQAVRACVQKKVKAINIITGGFAEVGREDLEDELRDAVRGTDIRILGVNCLGIFDSVSRVDTMFLPPFRLERPEVGGISYITQSGAVGSTSMDWASSQNVGIRRFISYGNATDLDESDWLEFLGDDPDTSVVIMYIEGVRDGRKFYRTARRVSKKKPVIVLKGGVTPGGNKAATSHTAVLAGNAEVYSAAFKQSGVIEAKNVSELFTFAKVLENQPLPKGKRIQVITDGGGFGVLASDAIYREKLELAQLGHGTLKKLKDEFPEYVVVGNPIDLIGDADLSRYEKAIRACIKDPGVDALLVILLYQVPAISSEVVEVVTDVARISSKPIVLVSAGGTFSEMHMDYLDQHGIPTFEDPEDAVKALRALVEYAKV